MGPRDAEYTRQFQDELNDIESDARRADEFIRGAEWDLCRDPTSGTRMPGESKVWFLPQAETPTSEAVNLYYTFDDECVYFLSIVLASEV